MHDGSPSAEDAGLSSAGHHLHAIHCTAAGRGESEGPMSSKTLTAVCLALVFSSPGACAADLTKLERPVLKEPVYRSNPKYCLLVFGPEAKIKIWLAHDGDVLYVDRNGNGGKEKGTFIIYE
jgi:hypothetical protein